MPKTTKTCEQCGRQFEAYDSDRVLPHTFCSIACSSAYAHRQRGHGTAQTIPCKRCDTPVQRYPSQSPRGIAYCSRACYAERKHPA